MSKYRTVTSLKNLKQNAGYSGYLDNSEKPRLFLAVKKSEWLFSYKKFFIGITQPAITCSKLTTETVGQGVKYVQS